MAKTKLSAKEFFQSTFPPVIAVMCSPAADEICSKNNMTFCELLQPFSKVHMEIHVREPSGTVAVLKELKLSVNEWNNKPPPSNLARKYLNESVSQVTDHATKSMKIGTRTIDVPISTPWFEIWRETFFKVQFPLDHEFTNHFIACIIAVSSHEEDLIGALTFMNRQLSESINSNVNLSNIPKWFSLNICKYIVMIHDTSVHNLDGVDSNFDKLKTVYGENNCYLLSINSQVNGGIQTNHSIDLWSQYISNRNTNIEEIDSLDQKFNRKDSTAEVNTIVHPLSPEIDNIQFSQNIIASNGEKDQMIEQANNNLKFGELLSSDDLTKLKQLMKDFINKSLVPFVESQIQNLTEIIANKKGVSRTFISATKRWFGTNKPGSLSPSTVTPPNSVIYTNDSQELQLRRLGDLCFMFGLYNIAFQAYHSAKRDFGADNAWLYYAGALEMASISAYMANIETRKAIEYLEESINCYLNHCKMPQFATRATLLSFEFLKDIGHYGESSKQLIRMTSEDSDLRSALLLEQAAYCYLYCSRNMPRKYAFHLVLAGHRYSKAKQRRHSLRCYKQAHQMYEDSGWSAATDHIHLTIGKQTATLQQLEEASEAMAKLLGPSKQIASQQEMFLREYILILQQMHKSSPGIDIVLPVPHVNQHNVQVLVGTPVDTEKPVGIVASGASFHESHANTLRWQKLEDQILSVVYNNVPFVFKPLVSLFNNETNNTVNPISVVGEKICVNVELWNPMNLSVHIQDLKLQIKSSNIIMQLLPISELTLAPESKSEVTLSAVPKSVGELNIIGIQYRLCSSNRDDLICIPGSQKFTPVSTKAKTSAGTIDHRLNINVIDSAPCLQVYFGNVKSTVLSNELLEIRMVLKNLGNQPITRVFVASSTPELFTLSSSSFTSPTVSEVPLPNSLLPGNSYILPMWLQAPSQTGMNSIDMLFYYQHENPTTSKSKLRYRLLRHTFQIEVLSSISSSVMASRSCSSSQLAHTVNIRVQMKNDSQESDNTNTVIHLENISLYSPHWKLKPLSLPTEYVKLDRQEISHSIFQATSKLNNEYYISDIDISQHNAPSLSQTPFKNFLLKTRSKLNTDDNRTDLSSISFKAKLVLRWKATLKDVKSGTSRDAFGQHVLTMTKLDELISCPFIPVLSTETSVPLKLFGPDRTLSISEQLLEVDSSILMKQLANYTLQYPQCVKHDFTHNKLAIIPVEVKVENFSSSNVYVHFNSNHNSSSIHSQFNTPHCLNSFRWQGHCVKRLTLQPNQSETMKLFAIITRPGTYDLQSRLLLTASCSDNKDSIFVSQCCKTDSILVIMEDES